MKTATAHEEISRSEAGDVPGQDVHLMSFLIVLSGRRKFIFYVTLGATLVAVVVTLLLPFQYTADTTLIPPGQSSSVGGALLSQLGGSGALASVAGASLGLKNPADMYVSLFHSRVVEDALIKRFSLASRYHAKKPSGARVALESRTKIVIGPKDGLITISVSDSDPKMSADLANGYVEEFRKLSAHLAITEASQRRVFFQQQLLEANQDLATAEEAMKNTEQSTGVLEINSQARSLIEAAAALRAQVMAKEVQLQAMRSYATESNSEIVLAEEQLAALKAQLAKLSGTEQSSKSDFLVPKGRIPGAEMEYVRKLRDVRYYSTISELISKQFEMAKLDEARQGATIQVVDSAIPPDSRSAPKRTLIVAGVMIFVFFASCLWTLVAERLRRLKESPQDREYIEALRASFRS
jgi:tyrosine-protein kinase Etk/Wzc